MRVGLNLLPTAETLSKRMGYEFDVCVCVCVTKNSKQHPLSFRVQIYITLGSINYKLREGIHSLEVLRNLQNET